MALEVLEKGLGLFHEYQTKTGHGSISICFHGGEPLLAGYGFYSEALPLIRKLFGQSAGISLQSNLLAIDEPLCRLFSRYEVAVGTSLDGPQEINDSQRGEGYFRKNRQGVELLGQYGITTGCITTFTSHSAPQAREIFHFFREKGISFEFHPAMKPLYAAREKGLYLKPEEYGELLLTMLELYLGHLSTIKLEPLDSLVKGICSGFPGLCTFSHCLGSYLVLAPEGELYSCTRFLGHREFSLGNVSRRSALRHIRHSSGWKKLHEWYLSVEQWCASCAFMEVCRGGCPYAGFAAGEGKPAKDPYCAAYRRVFSHILDRGLNELFREEHLDLLVNNEIPRKRETVKLTPLLSLSGREPHPQDRERCSREILAAWLLGMHHNPCDAASHMVTMNLESSYERALDEMEKLNRRLTQPPSSIRNLYLNITDRCNLACIHCFSENSGTSHLPVHVAGRWISDAVESAVDKVVLTGGEPLLSLHLTGILALLNCRKKSAGRTEFVFRTNFTIPLEREVKKLLFSACDRIVVSLDGPEAIHDARRGRGSYRMVMASMKALRSAELRGKISLAAVINYSGDQETISACRQHLFETKEKYGLREVRFSPLIPLGRARHLTLQRPPAALLSLSDWIARGYRPRAGCGFGGTLMLTPGGSLYPCHVAMNEGWCLGNAEIRALGNFTAAGAQESLRKWYCEAFYKCEQCAVKYICGSGCMIWAGKDCTSQFQGASSLVAEAAAYLGV